MTFHLTDACRAAITDAANRRTNQVVFTRMATGDGLAQPGVDDSGRVALRNERQRQGLTAVTGGAARIGVRASFTGAMGGPVWSVTEVGLIARRGGDPEFLAAYGAVAAGADPYAVVAPGVDAVIAATVDIQASAADVEVTVTPDLTVAGAATFAALLDTPGALTPLAYYRGNAGGVALEARTASAMLLELTDLMPRWQLDANFVLPARGSWEVFASLQVPPNWWLRGSIWSGGLGQARMRLSRAGIVLDTISPLPGPGPGGLSHGSVVFLQNTGTAAAYVLEALSAADLPAFIALGSHLIVTPV